MTLDESNEIAERIEIRAELDPHAAEALQLEIRRLAALHGVEIAELRVQKESSRQ